MTALSAYFIHTGRLRRWHGLVLLALYIAYWVVSFTRSGKRRSGPDGGDAAEGATGEPRGH